MKAFTMIGFVLLALVLFSAAASTGEAGAWVLVGMGLLFLGVHLFDTYWRHR